jgi:peptide deformylase
MNLEKGLVHSLERLTGKPELLPWDRIPTALMIPDTVLSNPQTLQSLYNLGASMTEGHFKALAFTQNPEKAFTKYHISKDLNNCIYISSDLHSPFDGCILINPTIQSDKKLYPFIERCGSIEHGSVNMIYLRPYRTTISGYAYSPATSLFYIDNYEMNGYMAAIIDHEHKHLQGKSAISDPTRLVNPCTVKDWKLDGKFYDQLDNNFPLVLQHTIHQGDHKWLVFKDHEFKVITISAYDPYILAHKSLPQRILVH